MDSRWRRLLVGIGLLCVAFAGLYYFAVWRENAEFLQMYRLLLAGRLSSQSATYQGNLVHAYVTVQAARGVAFIAGGVGALLCIIGLLWQAKRVGAGD